MVALLLEDSAMTKLIIIIIITHKLLIRKLTNPKGLKALVCGAEKYKR